MKRVILVAVSMALCFATGSGLSAPGSAPARTLTSACTRAPATFWALPLALSHAQACRLTAGPCPGGRGWGNVEAREIAGYTNNDWLWGGPAAPTFTVAQQDAFIAAAQTRALAARPATKSLIRIIFFTSYTVPVDDPTYVLGANASYGNCVPYSLTPR
jgi:hypothetical protein